MKSCLFRNKLVNDYKHQMYDNMQTLPPLFMEWKKSVTFWRGLKLQTGRTQLL